jgi:gliding motility-associated-like protein
MIIFNLRTIGFVFLFLIATSPVFAATFYVNDNSTSGDVFCTSIGNNGNDGLSPSNPKLTLANAFSAASSGDTILIDKGTYNEINLNLSKAITIIGAGPGNTIFTGNATVNRFASITANNVEIKNVTLRNYYANVDGQVITMSGVTGIIFNNIVVKDNQGNATSGANIAILAGSSVTVSNSLFSCSGWNSDGGGTLLVNASTLVVNTCVFKDVKNFADYGGAIEIRGAASNVNVTKSTFNECSARRGGAIYQDNGILTVTESCFINNFTAGDASDPSNGGAAYASNAAAGSSCSFTDCSFTNNSVNRDGDQNASSDGGAILFRNANGNFNFDLCSFSSNSVNNADKGQDFYLDQGGSSLTGVINNCTFGASSQTSGSNRVNIYNQDLASGNVILSSSGTPTFTGTAFNGMGSNSSSPSSTTTALCSNAALAACGAFVDCNTETNPPVIVSCVEDKTITDVCETSLLDYRLEVAAFDDCSFTITQSPIAGTTITTGTTIVTMTVQDQAGNISTCVFNVTLPGTIVTAPIIGTITQPTCTVSTGSVDLSGLPSSGTWTITPSVGSPFNGSGTTTTVNNLTESTTYTFTVTNDGGCVSPASNDVVINAQPNTVAPSGSGNQTFCSIDNPTVSDLSATGTNIQWYDAASGGSLLPGGTSLTDATHYYATQTVGGCESASRLDVLVNLNNPPAPVGSNPQPFCPSLNATVSDLSPSGAGISWYDASSGGTLLPGNTLLVDGNHYYASETLAGCEGTNRLDILVNIVDPAAPTGDANQTFCAIDNPTTDDLIVVGSNITWYDANSGGSVLISGTPLVDGNHYYASQFSGGCESVNRLDVQVTISDPSAPTGNSTQTFCTTEFPTVNELIATGTNLIWYDTPSNGTPYNSTDVLIDGWHYYASQTIAGCEGTVRFDVTVELTSPAAPTGDVGPEFCFVDSLTLDDLVITGTNVIWYDSDTDGSVLPGNTILVNETHYYASQTIAGCESFNLLDVMPIITDPTAPFASSSQTFCVTDSAQVNQLEATGSGLQWYDAPTGGNLLLDSDYLIHGSQYYVSQTVDGCESSQLTSVDITIASTDSPVGDTLQYFCHAENPTVNSLICIGNNIQWYDEPQGGNLLASSTQLEHNTFYYATQNVNGCESTEKFTVFVELDSIYITLVEKISTLCNESTGLLIVMAHDSYGTPSYIWNTGDLGETLSNLSEGVYIVTVTDTLGCSAELEVPLSCKLNDIPQIITPGGNGQNENWILNLKPEASVEIYNRWGNKIFEASPYLDDWNGKANTGLSIGSDFLPSGTYYYLIDMKDGEKPLNGFIELVR